MTVPPIRRVAVLGAGVMGSGIAAHVANAGLPVLLLDIVPPKAQPGEDTSSKAFRNKFAAGAKENLKKLKPSTRQRFVALGFDWPEPEIETRVLLRETRIDERRAGALVRLAGHIRKLSGMDLEEGVSTRLLVYAGSLMAGGMSVDRALQVAIIEPLTDDPDTQTALRDLAATVFG